MSGETICKRCGAREDAHLLVNYSDGGIVGAAALLCPTSTFASDPEPLRPPPPEKHEREAA